MHKKETMSEAELFIIEALKCDIKTVDEIHRLKNLFAVKYGRQLFSNIELLGAYKKLLKSGKIGLNRDFWNLLRKRGVRSKSGIVSVTVLTKHFPCPGSCIYCPSEPKMPKSYLSNEPAVMRAILSDFDAYKQTVNRLRSLDNAGHHTNKVEIIVSGGTFSFYKNEYKQSFIKGIYDALNSPAHRARTLLSAQKLNESAQNRCVGLSLETRPDYITESEVVEFRKLGATKIELGIQSLNDDVLKINKRGHTVAQSKEAIRLLKDAAFKVNCHMMPNLYGSNLDNDLMDFKILFADPDFRPDWLKIYPCMVVPWSGLEKFYNDGLFKPYSDQELIDLLIKIKMLVPDYVRITRLYRDIPAPTILAGSKLSNIRQKIHEIMDKKNLMCRCIRCREIQDEKVDFKDLDMKVDEYDASRGKEFFITYNKQEGDKLCSLLRLRFSSYSLEGRKHFIRELEGAALIREVHTYGEQVKIANDLKSTQHIGLGRAMIKKAEEISIKNGFPRIAVISGIGVREYYRKLGYELRGSYMVKNLV